MNIIRTDDRMELSQAYYPKSTSQICLGNNFSAILLKYNVITSFYC